MDFDRICRDLATGDSNKTPGQHGSIVYYLLVRFYGVTRSRIPTPASSRYLAPAALHM